MTSRAESLRAHLITEHGIDWENDALLDRDEKAMGLLHGFDHIFMDGGGVIDMVKPHEPDKLSRGTVLSLKKANAKEKAARYR